MNSRQSERNNAYAGRFGSPADVGNKRPTGSYRSQPAGSYRSRVGYEETRRPIARGSADSYTRRPMPSETPARKRAKQKKRGWKIALIILLALVIIAAAVLVIVAASGNEVVHQLPIIEPI